jgi:hypothetical protein
MCEITYVRNKKKGATQAPSVTLQAWLITQFTFWFNSPLS